MDWSCIIIIEFMQQKLHLPNKQQATGTDDMSFKDPFLEFSSPSSQPECRCHQAACLLASYISISSPPAQSKAGSFDSKG